MNENKPTWEEAVLIYIDVLQNPNAGFHATRNAKAELIRLAQSVDKSIAQRNSDTI